MAAAGARRGRAPAGREARLWTARPPAAPLPAGGRGRSRRPCRRKPGDRDPCARGDVAHAAPLPARRRSRARRGRAWSGEDGPREGACTVARARLLATAVHAGPAAVRRHRRQRLRPARRRRSASGPGRCSRTSCSSTRSTAPRRRRNRRCSRRCRSPRSPSTARRTRSCAPFLVIATQNPVEYEGTYPLPEAQLDRFAVRMAIGYPPLAEEARMLAEQTGAPPLDTLLPVADARRAPRRDRSRTRDLRRGERQPLCRRATAAHALEHAPGARRQPAFGYRAAAPRQGQGARRAQRLRHSGRRPGAGGVGARAPADPRSDSALLRPPAGRRRSARRSTGTPVPV